MNTLHTAEGVRGVKVDKVRGVGRQDGPVLIVHIYTDNLELLVHLLGVTILDSLLLLPVMFSESSFRNCSGSLTCLENLEFITKSLPVKMINPKLNEG